MVSATLPNFSCLRPQNLFRNSFDCRSISRASLSSSSLRFTDCVFRKNKLLLNVSSVSDASSSTSPDGDSNPYEILGVSPIEGFAAVKEAYTKKRKEAQEVGDEVTLALLEKAYDKLMMMRLTKRQKGLAYGSFKVSKDIKFADKQPIVPWGPRFAMSAGKDIQINLAISAAFTAWTLLQHNAQYKPLQFLAFAFVYRLFEKLRLCEPSPKYAEDAEDDRRVLRLGKRFLRAISLVFGCIAVASLAFTGGLNLYEMLIGYVPAYLHNNQEPIVTTCSAVFLFLIGSFYR